MNKQHVLSFEQLNEAVAATQHFKQRVTSRIYGAYIDNMVPTNDSGFAGKLPKDVFGQAAKRIKQAFAKAIYTIRGNNKIRHAEQGRFLIAELPKIVVKYNNVLYKPSFSIKTPQVKGSTYYLVGRNNNFKTVLLMDDQHANRNYLALKAVHNLKRMGDLVDDTDFDLMSRLSTDELMDRTDFYTAFEGGENDIIIDMSLTDEQFREQLGANFDDEEDIKTPLTSFSFAEIQGQAKEAAKGTIPEKQMQATKGREFAIDIAGEFKVATIDEATYFKGPSCVQIFTKIDGRLSASIVTRSGDGAAVLKRGYDKYKGMNLKIREKIWIKPAKVTEMDLEIGKRLYGLDNLTMYDMQFAYFFGEVAEVANSSRDGIIIKIQPTKMIFFKDGRLIGESNKYRKTK